MRHCKTARASFGKRLLATSSVLAIAAGISAAAHAGNVTNPAAIPNPTVNTGQTVTAIVFNDGATHSGSIVNNGTVSNPITPGNRGVSGTAIQVINKTTITGTILNNGALTGTISGTVAAIDTAGIAGLGLTGDGAAVTIMQDAGLIQG